MKINLNCHGKSQLLIIIISPLKFREGLIDMAHQLGLFKTGERDYLTCEHLLLCAKWGKWSFLDFLA